MNYEVNSHNRKMKYKFQLLVNRLSFNFLNLSGSYKVVLVWVILVIISSFFPWLSILSETGEVRYFTTFSLYTGYVGWILLLIIWVLTILLLSNTNKERLKTRANIVFPDYAIIIFSGVTIFLLSFVVLQGIRGLIVLTKGISIGKGIIFAILGALFVIFWWILAYRAEKKDLLEKIYVSNPGDRNSDLEDYEQILWKKNDKDSGNMSLPI